MLFNRPETTLAVFDEVREARPAKLFVAANGPRGGVPGDVELCKAVRKIFDDIDWECELHTNFPETNINMHIRWYTTLDWFFESVDSGIILEDDCVPDMSFFSYCTTLLEKYKNDPKIMHINGSNFQFGNKRGEASYYYSKFSHVWGWATWKRAWKKYDHSMSSFPQFKKDNVIDSAVISRTQKAHWIKFFEGLYSGAYNTCDAKWLYAIWANKGLCIAPNVNMISNIGYGLDAGHTVLKDKSMGQEVHDIGTLVHPTTIVVNRKADDFTFKKIVHKTFFQKALYRTVRQISKTIRSLGI